MNKKVKIALALIRLMPKIYGVYSAQKGGSDAEQDIAVDALLEAMVAEYNGINPGHENVAGEVKEFLLGLYTFFDGPK